jgi:hypothetical protein
MTLIDGDRIVTAQLYDDEHEEFTEQKMSIIDYVNAYTDEGVTTADEVLDKIRAEIVEYKDDKIIHAERNEMIDIVLDIIDKHIKEYT